MAIAVEVTVAAGCSVSVSATFGVVAETVIEPMVGGDVIVVDKASELVAAHEAIIEEASARDAGIRGAKHAKCLKDYSPDGA